MQTDTRYNGWTNYATWCVNLWLTNDSGSCEYLRDMALRTLDDYGPDDAAHHLARLIEDMHDEYRPDANKSDVYSDLLGHALSQVDWLEIAEHVIDEDLIVEWHELSCADAD